MAPLWRVFAQRPDLAHPDPARTPLCRVRRAQPDLGDARRHRQAQRAAARSPAIEQPVPPSIAEYDRRHPLDARTPSRVPRRRSPRSPTTSPTTTTISTTGCAPGCSRSPISPMCRWSARCSRRSRGAIPGIEEARLIHEAIRRVIDRMVRDLIGETARRLAGERRRQRRRGARSRTRRSPLFPTRCGDHDRALKRFLFERMYRHHRVNRMTFKGAPRRPRAVSAVPRRAGMPAARMAPRLPAASEAERGADRRRLSRRHDRPIRPRRASPVVRYLRAGIDPA